MSKCIICIIDIFRTNEYVKQNRFLWLRLSLKYQMSGLLKNVFDIFIFLYFLLLSILILLSNSCLTRSIYQKYQNCSQMLPFLLLLKSRCILKDEYIYIPFSLEQTSKQLITNVYTFTYIENISFVYTSVY